MTRLFHYSVQLRPIAIPMISFFLFAFAPVSVATPASEKCKLPADLQHQVVTAYPNAKLVNMSDLDADDQKFFQKDHGDACPGLVKVDFYGDGKPTLALVLITKGSAKDKAKLVVAHQVGGRWVTIVLDTADGVPIPVVWSLPAGQYEDVYGKKTIRAARPVIVFTGYEGWSILYAWTGTRVTKIWLMD